MTEPAALDALFHILVDAIAAEMTPGHVINMNDIDDAASSAIRAMRHEVARSGAAAERLASALGLTGVTTP